MVSLRGRFARVKKLLPKNLKASQAAMRALDEMVSESEDIAMHDATRFPKAVVAELTARKWVKARLGLLAVTAQGLRALKHWHERELVSSLGKSSLVCSALGAFAGTAVANMLGMGGGSSGRPERLEAKLRAGAVLAIRSASSSPGFPMTFQAELRAPPSGACVRCDFNPCACLGNDCARESCPRCSPKKLGQGSGVSVQSAVQALEENLAEDAAIPPALQVVPR